MALTSIGDQRTPGRPIEITIGAELGLTSAQQNLLLFGHGAATGGAGSGTASVYSVYQMSNVSDPVAGATEANAAFGSGSELAKMVIAAINANAGGSNFPPIKCVRLNSTDTDFGPSDAALTAAKQVEQEFAVSPYDAMNGTLLTKLLTHAQTLSGAQRVENSQYGTMGVAANYNTVSPASLSTPDTQYLSLAWFRNTGAQAYSLGETAAAYAAVLAGNAVPFNPLDSVTIGSLPAPANLSDYPSVGAGLESEAALTKGWTPLRTTASGVVQIVRAITSRITVAGTGTGPLVTAYYDVQDFQVLYYWRRVLFARFSQSDFKTVKASDQTGNKILGEVLRLAGTMEDQNMFQHTADLGKEFIVQRSLTDRHRFDVLTPVNVIPGLHVIATSINATTEFDSFTV